MDKQFFQGKKMSEIIKEQFFSAKMAELCADVGDKSLTKWRNKT